MTCIKHCTCPNCMARFERKAYKMDRKRDEHIFACRLAYGPWTPEMHEASRQYWRWMTGTVIFSVLLAWILVPLMP